MPGISRLAIAGLCAVALAMAGCARGAGGAPPSPTPVPLDEIYPPSPRVIVGVDAEHVVITEPLREVIPPPGPDDVKLTIAYTTTASHPPMLGIEGWVGFLQATDPDGTVVLDGRVIGQTKAFTLPAGRYQLRAYYRPCDANCGTLDPPIEFCSLRDELVPGRDYQLVVMLGAFGSSGCRLDR